MCSWCNDFGLTSTFNMEDHNYHQVFIETEVDDFEDHFEHNGKIILSEVNETNKNSINVKIEHGIDQEDQNDAVQCRLKMKEETLSETENNQSGTIYSTDFEIKDEDFEEISINKRDVEETSDDIPKSEICSKTGIPNYKCDKCDYMTSTKSCHKQHEFKHLQDKPFKCNKCSYRTITASYLRKHQLVHSNVRPFKCDKCDYSAKTNRELKRHQRIHIEIKPYKCDACNYRTHTELFLKRHQSIHEKLLVVEKFGCTECGYVTKYKASLTKHLLLHRDLIHRENH